MIDKLRAATPIRVIRFVDTDHNAYWHQVTATRQNVGSRFYRSNENAERREIGAKIDVAKGTKFDCRSRRTTFGLSHRFQEVKTMYARLFKFLNDKTAATAQEYAVMVAGVVLVTASSINGVGVVTGKMMNRVIE
ncbi:MAG: hypothetical protein D6753_10955, partial [Planctomycetota bacterium]